jgi:hypothetical protein
VNTLEHISELFADSVFQEMQKKRFGLKTCRAKVDAELADDLRNIYMRNLERKDCGCTVEYQSCSQVEVEERINTL